MSWSSVVGLDQPADDLEVFEYKHFVFGPNCDASFILVWLFELNVLRFWNVEVEWNINSSLIFSTHGVALPELSVVDFHEVSGLFGGYRIRWKI